MCMYMFDLNTSLSNKQLLVSVCMYMHIHTVERLQQHQAVILLLIMKYFELKIFLHSRTTIATMQPYQSIK